MLKHSWVSGAAEGSGRSSHVFDTGSVLLIRGDILPCAER